MEERARIRPLPGLGENPEEGRPSEPSGVREDRIRLLNEITSEGLQILKNSERHLPDTVDRLSPSSRKQLGDLMHRGLAVWRKVTQEVNSARKA